MPKAQNDHTKPARKSSKRKFDTLESYVKTLSNQRHPDLHLNPDAKQLLTRLAQDTVFRLAEGGVDLMHWRNTKVTTLRSVDVRVFIEATYPPEISGPMLSRCRKAERKFSKANAMSRKQAQPSLPSNDSN